jgi:putative ABC transport system substrate-binding protein
VRRREFITLISGAVVSWPLVSRAEQPERVRRIGVLLSYSEHDPQAEARVAAFRDSLQGLGWTNGRNAEFEFRYAEGKLDRLQTLADQLVRMNVDVILTAGTESIQAGQRATASIPIVMATVGDPTGAGIVTNLARPGGNVTGFSLLATELSAKRLELLKETIPALNRLAVLWNPDNASVTLKFKEIEAAARTAGIQTQALQLRRVDEIEMLFEFAKLQSAQAIITTEDALQVIHRGRIIDLTKRQGIPVAAEFGEFAHAGALMSYGPDILDMFRRAAGYVDKILRGNSPADLPVQQPTKFELVINLKTAKALGLTIPPSVLTRADEVIE